MRLDGWTQHVQLVHALVIAVGVVLRHFHWLEVFQTGFLCNLVFAFLGIVLEVPHIGDVAHITDFIAKVRQVTEHQVESDGRTGMTQMGIAINGRAANVHAHMRGVQRFERLLATRQRVVNV